MSAVDGTRAAQRARLHADVALAAQVVTPLWSIETFIAVNPLGGLEDRPFGEAVALAGELTGARGLLDEREYRTAHARGRVTDADLRAALRRRHHEVPDLPAVVVGGRVMSAEEVLLADLLHGTPAPPPQRRVRTPSEELAPEVIAQVDDLTVKWCAAFLGSGHAAWPIPGGQGGFWHAWRDLAARDHSLPRAVRLRLRGLPERPEDAALDALEALGVGDAERRGVLRAHLTRLPGWAAHVRRRAEQDGDVDLTAYLAVRLAYEAALLAEHRAGGAGAPAPRAVEQAPDHASPAERAAHLVEALGLAGTAEPGQVTAVARVLDHLPVAERALVWQEAYEGHYRDGLLGDLDRPAAAPPPGRPAAQVVCCIDTRSEGLRRHLEALGDYETLGFAGFFAVAIRYQDLAGGAAAASCPVLLEPRNAVEERPAPGAGEAARRRVSGLTALAGAEDGFHAAKEDLLAPFTLAEAAGWAAGPLAAAKTLLAGPYGAVRTRLGRAVAPPAPAVLDVGLDPQERAHFGEVALTMMGLTSEFARLVVLCGHGSTTENNPYGSALDCGACGGHRGGPNARTAAAVLNSTAVRDHLAGRGITIPADTWFVAAEHDTATDRVLLLDRHLVPASHHDELDALAADLATAGARLSRERCAQLPGAPRDPSPARAARHVRARSTDWAQVYPEWGLAGNAAFVVGPRSMTRGLDLGRRVFLHSYDAEVDRGGEALETILTAPLVVAQWINCQYYFSTVDPEVFGAGSKTVHNVVGGIGVLAGHTGDLRTGLPWQSVAVGDRLVHEPVRLLAVVQAPLARIEEIVARNSVLRHLFDNEWVALAAREGPGQPWQRHTPQGWTPWTTRQESTP